MGFITAPEFRRVRGILRWLSFALLLFSLVGAGISLYGIHGPHHWSQVLGDEVQLMAGSWQQPSSDKALPWTLTFLPTLIPLLTTAFGFLVLVDIATGFRGLTRNHIVLVGDGAAATAVAARLRRPRGTKGPKQRLLVTKAGDPASLRDSGIKQARAVVVCGDDTFDGATNVATTKAALPLARREDFTAHLLVGDPGLALALRARRLVKAAPDDEDQRIRVFTVDELAARNHMRGVTLEHQTRPHVLVVSSDGFGQAVIVELARRWSAEGSPHGTPLVTLVARDAHRALQAIADRWPFVARTCELRALEQPVEQAMLSIPDRPFRSYFCDDDEDHALRTALTAATRWRPGPGSIVVRLTRLATQSEAFTDIFDDLGGALDPVSVYDAAAQEIVRSEEPLLAFARAIHQSYLDDATRRGEALRSRPLLVPWDELPEDAKESNLQQARAFPRTLATISCSVAPRSRMADPFFFLPGEVERLARGEHEHWVAERRAAGWKYGQTRNQGKRTHPLLVPWERLSDDVRSRNRAIVKERPLLFDRALEREGLQVVRLAVDPAATGPAPTPAWLTPGALDLLARNIHERYLADRVADGEAMFSRPSLQHWDSLSDDLKEANRAQVRDIGAKLDVLEATVVREPATHPFDFSEDEVEMLARYEHDRWVSQRIAAGWTYGPERDDAHKVHNLLLPWLYLSSHKQETDRQMIRALPDQLKAAGLSIVRR
ncbi:MAG TPA: RyR domain-containing protein [Micromonosporaceae bacterium]